MARKKYKRYKNPFMIHTPEPNPALNPSWKVSDCCQVFTAIIPACFGDPAIRFCKKCNLQCSVIEFPYYEKISQGTYRKIQYPFLEQK